MKPGSVTTEPYNHYSLLRSVEDLFGLGHLGYAARAGLRPFGADVFAGQGPARDSTPPQIRIAGVPRRHCVRRGFRARVRVLDSGRLRRGALFRDGRRLRRTLRKRYVVPVRARRLRAGRHRVRVVAVDADGNRRERRVRFTRCRGR